MPFPTDRYAHGAFLYAGDPAQRRGEYCLLTSSEWPGNDIDSCQRLREPKAAAPRIGTRAGTEAYLASSS